MHKIEDKPVSEILRPYWFDGNYYFVATALHLRGVDCTAELKEIRRVITEDIDNILQGLRTPVSLPEKHRTSLWNKINLLDSK